MDVAQTALLIGAFSTLLAAFGGIVVPIIVARIKRDSPEPPPEEKVVEQGQPVDHLGTLLGDILAQRDRAQEDRNYWRQRAETAEARVRELENDRAYRST